MQSGLIDKIRRGIAPCCVAGICLTVSVAAAQNRPPRNGRAPVRVLMVSDIHFDPFADPGKVEKLAAAPASKWPAILGAASSPDRAERFAALQKTCHAKGSDTDYALLESSLRAMRADASGARFILVSGDLLAHEFSCKYNAAVGHATADGHSAFAAKTLEFVLKKIRNDFPGVPVYAALGNNDSSCGDYRIDAGGAFLRAIAPALTADIPANERREARREILAGGYYGVTLPAPMQHTRLLVLDDVFMSSQYETCGGTTDPAPAGEQLAWLRARLALALRNHEQVWVMAHIPPGIDPYSTIRKMANVCAGGAPVKFLSSDALPDTIAEFGDVIRLAVFGHTHMDELRLLRAKAAGKSESAVALKLVPSISPVDGNNPSFVVAAADPASATITDYHVIAASNLSGVGTEWRQEYDFDRAYGASEFSAESVERLIRSFRADSAARTPASDEYLRDYFVGDRSALLKLVWPEYTCALVRDSAAGFRSCACSGGIR
jgi:sphingomyelin phosphodiesterase acid-like 3